VSPNQGDAQGSSAQYGRQEQGLLAESPDETSWPVPTQGLLQGWVAKHAAWHRLERHTGLLSSLPSDSHTYSILTKPDLQAQSRKNSWPYQARSIAKPMARAFFPKMLPCGSSLP
jgi:hypothetical protein